MTFPLPTDTAHVRIESRQYRLLNFDLGEGIRRSSMKVAALVFVPWIALMLIFSVSILTLPWLWFGVPSLVTWAGVRRDDSGRLAIRSWTDAVLFRLGGSRPIINGETESAETPMPAHDIEFVVMEP